MKDKKKYKQDPPIGVRLKPDLLYILNRYAAKKKIKRHAVIVSAIADYLIK